MAKKIPNVVSRNRVQTPLANALQNEHKHQKEEVLENVSINDELRDLIPPLQEEEFNRLEQNILEDKKGIREPIKLWKQNEKFVIVDGHNRYAIAQKHSLKFPFEVIELSDIEEVKEWMVNFQLGRRNLSPEQTSYLRGFLYNQLKQKKGGNDKVLKGQNPKGQNVPLDMTTAEFLAQQYNVSDKTIKRDGLFAQAISLIGDTNAELKRDLLAGKVKAKKTDIQELVKTDKEELTLNSVADIALLAEEVRALRDAEIEFKRWNKKYLLNFLDADWYLPIFENKVESSAKSFWVKDYSSILVKDTPSINSLQLLHFADEGMMVLIGLICIGSKAQLKKVNFSAYLEYLDYITFVIPEDLKEAWNEYSSRHAVENIGCIVVDTEKTDLIVTPQYLDPTIEKTKSLLLEILIQKLK
ncbi:MAG: hypothetical protein GY828_01740 [Candidatus Gracilibacteria bacterium]|nr:hypothetical protein [Candidatus Gracilibacteria bacterium]